jgi:hypothetical protein
MADFTGLNQAETDLATAVSAVATNMDKLFAELQAAQASGDQAAVDAATAAIQTQIQALKDAVTRDPAGADAV